jgi:dTDP-glucose 4,6-dehydratase
MERSIVTGGAGFIGSHLCEYLLAKGHEVICMDNLSTGSKSNIKHLIQNKRFKFLNKDITRTQKMKIAGEIDYIFHLASPASPVDYQKLAIETLLVNSLGTNNTLELAREKKASYVLASSSEVYGDPTVHPQREEYWGNVNPIGRRSCYDEGKRFAEALAMAYHRKYNLDIRIARIFNTYGARMRLDDGRAVPNFIAQALNNKPLTVHGNGLQTRSFCYISDMVEGITRLMFTENIGGEVVNLGNPEEIAILELAKLVIELANSKSNIIYTPLPEDDPERRKPDISKAKKILGWEPKVKLRDGLRITIEWFKKNKENKGKDIGV